MKKRKVMKRKVKRLKSKLVLKLFLALLVLSSIVVTMLLFSDAVFNGNILYTTTNFFNRVLTSQNYLTGAAIGSPNIDLPRNNLVEHNNSLSSEIPIVSNLDKAMSSNADQYPINNLGIASSINKELKIQGTISSCGTIISNSTLTNNITTNGTCFTIGASNIVLDCGGYTIIGNTSVATDYGIVNNAFDNVTITNCNIYGFYEGIYIYNNADNNLIHNNYLFNWTNTGVVAVDSQGSNIFNNSFRTGTNGGYYGMFLTNVDNSNITNNTFNGDYLFYTLRLFSTSANDNIWQNRFNGFDGISDSGVNNLFCVNNLGNYYNGTVEVGEVPSYDCGPTPNGAIYVNSSVTANNFTWGGNSATYMDLRTAVYNTFNGTNNVISFLTDHNTSYSQGSAAVETVRNNITIDCQWYRYFDPTEDSASYGVYINGEKNITVKHCYIDNFDNALRMDSNGNVNMYENVLDAGAENWGMFLVDSDYSNIFNNTFRGDYGFYALDLRSGSIGNSIWQNSFNGTDGVSDGGTSTSLCVNGLYGNYYNRTVEVGEVPSKDCGPTPNGAIYVNSSVTANNFTWGGNSATYMDLRTAVYNTFNGTNNIISFLTDHNTSYSQGSAAVETVRNNITIDCQGYRYFDPTEDSASYGAYINGEKNITVKHCYIDNFDTDIYIENNGNGNIYENVLDAGAENWGMFLVNSDYSNIFNNTFRGDYGFYALDLRSGGVGNNVWGNSFNGSDGVSDGGTSTSLCVNGLYGNYYNGTVEVGEVPVTDCGPTPNATSYINQSIITNRVMFDSSVNAQNVYKYPQEAYYNTRNNGTINFLSDSILAATTQTIRNNVLLDCRGYNFNVSATALNINGEANNTIQNCNIFTTGISSVGIQLSSANYSRIINTKINTSGSSATGITFSSSSNNNIINSSFNVSSTTDISLASTSTNNVFLGTIFNKDQVSFSDAASELFVRWNVFVKTIDTDALAVNNAYVNISNVTNSLILINYTDNNGLTSIHALQEYVQKSTGKIFSTPHMIYANKTGYRTNSTTINVSQTNSTVLNIVLSLMDVIPPRFDPFPVNQTIEANTTFVYDFNATDDNSMVTFGVNDTAFNINSTGGLVNATSLQFRTYVLNITINDTANNKNFTYFQVRVQDTTQPRFDPMPTNQTIEFGANFNYDINGTDMVSEVTFGINSTEFVINSTGGIINTSPFSNIGIHIFNITINDTSNNKNSTFFQIVVQDTTSPRFDPMPINQTIEFGANFNYDIDATDDLFANYSINYTSLFTINNTGAIVNSSPILDLGVYHFNISINDTSNNRNSTFFSITVQDTMPPRFDPMPTNQTIEANTTFVYDINAIDNIAVQNYSINYTSLFTINNTGAIVNSSPILEMGVYHFNISINDTSNNVNWTFFSVTVQDTRPPRFDPMPMNQTIEYSTNFYYDINATDNIGIQNFSINYTTLFAINNTGGLRNISAITTKGTYYFNVSINDTSNNVNWTFFQLTIEDTTPPRFDPHPINQTIEANTTFLYDVNATDALFANYSINYTSLFMINNTGAIVNSSSILSLGTYHFNISINDTSNNVNWTFFQLTVQDTTPPRFDPFPTNQTLEANTTFVYDLNATDTVSLVTFGINDTAFNINSTGGLMNATPLQFRTYVLNITINDTANNKNFTYFQVRVQDTTPPRFDPMPTNQTIEFGANFNYDINATDNIGIYNYSINYTTLFAINNTGGLRNISSLEVGTYTFNISINDTSNNRNSTLFSLTMQAAPPSVPPSSPTSGSGGGGGGGSKKSVEIITPECAEDSACAPRGFCKEQKCISYECVENSDCPTEKYCVKNKCYKIFDIKLLQADSPVLAGDSLDFVYFLKGMADISGDVVIQFWLEKNGKKISLGADTIYIGTYEEKTEQAALFLPSNLKEGEYTLYVELNYKDYIVQSYRTIEIQKQPELVGSVVFANLPATISSQVNDYTMVLATNKDVPVSATVVHQIMKEEEIIWSKQEEIMINHSTIIINPLPLLEKGVYYFTTKAIIGGKSYTAQQMVTVDVAMQKAAVQQVTGKLSKSFAGQAIGDVTEILSDYTVLWFMIIVLVPMLYLFFRSRRQTQTEVKLGVKRQTMRTPSLTELEQWMQTMISHGAPHDLIINAAKEQGDWSAKECKIALDRALARYNLKNAYGDFVTEQKLQELKAFIERSFEQGIAEERIIAHLVEAEWNTKFISDYVRAYTVKL